MQNAGYLFGRFWIKLGIKLFYRRIEIHGFENYPAKGPVLLAPNHQNAFMDALIPAVFAPRPIHFLVRADVFKSKFARYLFNSVNMMPVYRQRDGIANLTKNDEVFERCFKILRANGTLLIFPEATHLGVRRLRNLSKGFTRIAFGALNEHEDLNIQIVPVGLNYSNYSDSQSRLIVNFGKSLSIQDYLPLYAENPAKAMANLRTDVQERLENEIVHIEREDAGRAFDIELDRLWPFYLQRAQGFSQPVNQHQFYKNREQSIQKIAPDNVYFRRIKIYDIEMKKRRLRAPFFFIGQKDPGYWVIQNILLSLFLPIFLLSWIMHAPSYFLIRGILKKYVGDRQFHSSIKLIGSILLFPVFMIVYAVLAAYFTGRPLLSVSAVLLFFPLSVFIIRELRLPYRYAMTMWNMLFLRAFKPELYKYLKQIEEDVLPKASANANGAYAGK